MPRHPLILDGSLTPLAGHQNCACTFYLVFKEPASASRQTHSNFVVWGTLRAYPFAPSPVNNFFRCVRAFPAKSTGVSTAAGLTEMDQLGVPSTQKNLLHLSSGANLPAARAGARSVRSLYDPARTLSTSS